jgi:hypothetical protein
MCGHTIRIGDTVTFRNHRPPLGAVLLVEEVNSRKQMVTCRGRVFGREGTFEVIPARKLVTCVDAFLRGRRRVVESYRADFCARSALGTEAFAIWIDRYRDHCQLNATIFARGEDGDLELAHSFDRILTGAQWDELAEGVESDGFWDLPNGNGEVCLDGSWWILEGVKGGRYHYVRRCCDGPAVCVKMAQMAQIWR